MKDIDERENWEAEASRGHVRIFVHVKLCPPWARCGLGVSDNLLRGLTKIRLLWG